MAKSITLAGIVFMGLAVALGAFGGHVMADLLTPDRLATWQTAVKYQAWHGLALLVLGEYQARTGENPWIKRAFLGIVTGTLLFSGSLYLLCLTQVTLLGAVTPLGGLGFLLGWAFWAISLFKKPSVA